jgi:hypothetical protein
VQAFREAHRVLRPGGFVFAACISRFASLLDGLTRNLIDDPAFCDILNADLKTGQHRNPKQHPDYFTTAFFHTPADVEQEIAEAGLKLESLFAVEGPAWILPNLAERMSDPAKRGQLLELLRAVERDRSLVGMSAHLLAVAQKSEKT